FHVGDTVTNTSSFWTGTYTITRMGINTRPNNSNGIATYIWVVDHSRTDGHETSWFPSNLRHVVPTSNRTTPHETDVQELHGFYVGDQVTIGDSTVISQIHTVIRIGIDTSSSSFSIAQKYIWCSPTSDIT